MTTDTTADELPEAFREDGPVEDAHEPSATGDRGSRAETTGDGRRSWWPLGLAALSAVGMVLCCPAYDVWWLGFVAWIPLYTAIEGCRPRRALFYGWVTGFITVFWGFFWMTDLMTRFAMFPFIAAVGVTCIFAAFHGLLWGGAMMLTAWVSRRTRVPLWLFAPLCWVSAEALMPSIFPIHMALAWCWQPLWIQAAELGGVTMVSGIIVAFNAGLYCLGRAWLIERRIDIPAAAFTAALFVVVPGYGAVRIAQVQAQMDAAPHVKIGAVQGNMSIRELVQDKMRVLDQQREVSAQLQAQGAEFMLWGETAYPHSRVFVKQSIHEPPPQSPWRIHTPEFTVPILVGAVTRDLDNPRGYPWNTALLVDSDGAIEGTYDKVFLLIFGEYIPLIDPEWYLARVPGASHLNFGEGPKALPFTLTRADGSTLELRLGPVICYEDILPRYVRQVATQDVHVLLNLTNDAWFGKTAEPRQHLGLAVFRAVEQRKGLVRAVNTGVSGYVDPVGRTLHATEVTDPEVDGPQMAEGFVADVPMMDPTHHTPFGRTGELFNILCIAGVALLLWRGR